MNENLAKSQYQICATWLTRGTSEVTTDIPAWLALIDLTQKVQFATEKGDIIIKVDWGTMKHRISTEVEFDDLFWKLAQDENIEMQITPIQNHEKVKGGSFEEERLQTIASLKEYFQTKDDQHLSAAIKKVRQHMHNAKDNTKFYRINCTLISQESSEEVRLAYIKIFIYYIFLAMNFASPGSCNFYVTRIITEDRQPKLEPSQKESSQEKRISIPSHHWESARDMQGKLQWPDMPIIPVSDTWAWLQGTTFSVNRLAETNIERALFALLHSFREEQAITQLLWLTLALEALYDTPTEGIIRHLKKRIFLFLGTPSAHAKKITKLINTFYNLRSRFVHGSSPIINPITSAIYECEDEPDDKDYETLREAADFATLLVIATLQKMIYNKWNRIKFYESFEGQE